MLNICYSETSVLNGAEKLCGDVGLSKQYQTDKVLLVQQTAGVRLQKYPIGCWIREVN